MLTEKQVKEIKEHLERAQNPIFFFDNDPDGLCSFLILRRYLGRGKGVAVKSFPDLDSSYFRKVQELGSDYIFILDKPMVSKEFFKEVEQNNIPVVWIDHHEVQVEIPEWVDYYNPLFKDKLRTKKQDFAEPVTYICYQITQKKEDMWIAVVGSVSDRFVPDFYDEFKKKYPDLSVVSENAFDIFYNSQIGKIAKMFSFALKDRTTNVVGMIKFLVSVLTPYEVLDENKNNFSMHKRFKQIDLKYLKLLKKAKEMEKPSEKVLFFQYGGDLSISSDLSKELSYKFTKKIIIVSYIKGPKANISVRGKNAREIVLKAIEGLEGATGGGHKEAVGAKMNVEDLETFRKNLLKLVD
jgi:single-stranded DNA-specific DHH superfamily exonuclease